MCDERERMLDYLYGELDPAGRLRAEAHVQTCRECRGELRGLQVVRDDLTAWEVPVRGSVWTPFVPPRVLPWWRQMPAWAFATAAALLLAVGVTGGFAAHALTAPVAVAAAPAPPIAPLDLDAVEARVLADLQAAGAPAQAVPVAAAARASTPARMSQTDRDALLQQVRSLIAESARQQRYENAVSLQGLMRQLEIERTTDYENIQDTLGHLTEQQSGAMRRVLDLATHRAQDVKIEKEK